MLQSQCRRQMSWAFAADHSLRIDAAQEGWRDVQAHLLHKFGFEHRRVEFPAPFYQQGRHAPLSEFA